MAQRYFFKSNDIGYPEFLKTIETMMKEEIIFCDKDCIETGINALDKLNKTKQSRLIDVSYSIDRIFHIPGVPNRNCGHKLPIILKSADFLAKDNIKIDNLTNDELILLSYYYSVSKTSYDTKRFDFFLDKNVLKCIQNKSDDIEAQSNMIFIIDMKLQDSGVNDMNDEQYKVTKENMINMINSSSKEEILDMVNFDELIAESMEELYM